MTVVVAKRPAIRSDQDALTGLLAINLPGRFALTIFSLPGIPCSFGVVEDGRGDDGVGFGSSARLADARGARP